MANKNKNTSAINSIRGSLPSLLSDIGIAGAFLVAISALLGSLFFSEVLKWLPCDLCWYQRVFMYPQVVLLGIALYKNDTGVKKYCVALSIIGIAIAIYHFFLQMYPTTLPCTAGAVSCAIKYYVIHPFITIPFMSMTAYAGILFFLYWVKEK